MYTVLLGALFFFLVLPIFLKMTGWHGKKAHLGLIMIAGLYWLYSWYTG